MKKQLFIPFLLLCIAFGHISFAQTTLQNLPEVKPLPPNLASLYKVQDRPIGTYTGTVPIQFPLMSVSSGLLNTSLSLNYNSTGGIRVEEVASSVGLGFSLIAGGSIVQIVNDLTDLKDFPQDISDFNCSDMDDFTTKYYYNSAIDLEPDIFMYNFNGQSGRFFFKEDGTIVMMNKTGLKIEYIGPSNGTAGKWVITDEQGNTYYFGKNKAGNSQYYGLTSYTYTDLWYSTPTYSTPPAISSWYLAEVYDMNEENKITYTYQGSGYDFSTHSSGYMSVYDPNAGLAWGGPCGEYNLNSSFNVKTNGSECLVSRIDANSGYIIIDATDDRQDDFYSMKVNAIKLYTPDDMLIKEYKFNYSYFGNQFSEHFKKRLKLKDFSQWEINVIDRDSLSYTFEYKDGTFSRYTKAVDFWGFYNGQNSNTTIFPNYVFKTSGLWSELEFSRLDYANKNAYSGYAKANILTKITYPTGGTREFEYEGNTALTLYNSNEYHPGGGADNSNNTIPQSFSINNNAFENFDPDADLASHLFSVNSDNEPTQLSYTLSFAPTNSTCQSLFEVYKIDPNSSNDILVIGPNSVQNTSFSLDNGDYRIDVYKSSTTDCEITDLTVSWLELRLASSPFNSPHDPFGNYNRNNTSVGGVRVKEIRDYDPVTNRTYKTEYKYKLYSTDSLLTSGLLITKPDLIKNGGPYGLGAPPSNCHYFKLITGTNNPLTSYGGSYVVYPEVRTIEHGNGWTDHTYSFARDDFSPDFPEVPPTDYSAYRGQLLEKKVFHHNGALLKKTTNTYISYGWPISQFGLRIEPFFKGTEPFDPYWSDTPYYPNQAPSRGICNSYALFANSRDILRTIDSTFTTTGTFVTKTEYDYDFYDERQLFLKRIKQTLNNGDVKTKTYNYTYTPDTEFVFGLNSSELTMKTTLNNKNYRLPIEERDSLLVSGGTDLFLGGGKVIFTDTANKTRLSNLKSFSGSTESNSVNFTSYSDYGQLQEQYRDDGVKEVYLWGYDGQYPVAKVIGSDYATIISGLTSQELDDLQSQTTTDAQKRIILGKIRTNLVGTTALVTTYTYNPLVGITSVTDPKDYTIYYEYDDFNRLIEVKDDAGKILSQNAYHYKN